MLTQYLDTPEGRIAFDVAGEGPLIICAPGMGDLRSTYRHLAPRLVAAGYRVATVDLRGHGDSDSGFSSYGDEETASDLGALVTALGEPAVIVGNSMAAGAGVILAAERPGDVRALVLLGPFVRNPAGGRAQRALMRAAMAPLWARQTWAAFLPSLYAGTKPGDFEDHRTAITAALGRPGYTRSFSKTMRLSHAPAEAALSRVTTPTLVVMGELDPDFTDPLAEATWIGHALSAEIVMVPDAGHYPQAQRPDVVAPAILGFLATAGVNA